MQDNNIFRSNLGRLHNISTCLRLQSRQSSSLNLTLEYVSKQSSKGIVINVDDWQMKILDESKSVRVVRIPREYHSIKFITLTDVGNPVDEKTLLVMNHSCDAKTLVFKTEPGVHHE